ADLIPHPGRVMKSRITTLAPPRFAPGLSTAEPFAVSAVEPAAPDGPRLGSGKCTSAGCSCPSYVEPVSGFDCRRCGHPKSDHW
ncbi:hypothetical protein ACG2DA_22705, partial [Alienimonas sp. DA493]